MQQSLGHTTFSTSLIILSYSKYCVDVLFGSTSTPVLPVEKENKSRSTISKLHNKLFCIGWLLSFLFFFPRCPCSTSFSQLFQELFPAGWEQKPSLCPREKLGTGGQLGNISASRLRSKAMFAFPV